MTEIAGATRPSSLRAVFQSLLRGRDRTPSARQHDHQRSPAAHEFARLGRQWRVLDDVSAGRRLRLEHLVIGPGGVFAVTGQHNARDTICLGGESLLVNGNRVHHGRLSRECVAEVSARLTDTVGFAVPVAAVVLIVGDRRFVVPKQPDEAIVRVATPAASVRWMRRHSVALTSSAVERVYAAACDPETWAPRRPVAGVERAPRQHEASRSRDAG